MCKIEILRLCLGLGFLLIDFSRLKRKNVVNYHLGAWDWSCAAFKCSIHNHWAGDSLSNSSHIFSTNIVRIFFSSLKNTHTQTNNGWWDRDREKKIHKNYTQRNVQPKQKWSLIKRIFSHSHSTYADVIRLASNTKFTSFSLYTRKMPQKLCSNSCKQLPNIHSPMYPGYFSVKEISLYLLNKQRNQTLIYISFGAQH